MIESAGDSGGTATAVADGGSPPATNASPESASPGTTTAAGDQATELRGPVPYERFEEVNRKYGTLKWAEEHDQDRVRQQAQFFRWLDTDPEGAFRYMESYLSRAGILQAKQETAQASNGDGRPQADIVVPETGQRFYSAEAAEKLAKWEATQATKPIEERMNSFEADRDRVKYRGEAARQLQEMESRPYYKEHEAAILKEMERDGRLSLEGAYNRVVVPKIRDLERQTVLKEIKQKSEASTVSPGTTTATQTISPNKLGWSELFRREMAKRGGRA